MPDDRLIDGVDQTTWRHQIRRQVLDAQQHIEREPKFERANGYDSLTVKFIAR